MLWRKRSANIHMPRSVQSPSYASSSHSAHFVHCCLCLFVCCHLCRPAARWDSVRFSVTPRVQSTRSRAPGTSVVRFRDPVLRSPGFILRGLRRAVWVSVRVWVRVRVRVRVRAVHGQQRLCATRLELETEEGERKFGHNTKRQKDALQCVIEMKIKPVWGGKVKNAFKEKIKRSMCGMWKKVNESYFFQTGKMGKERKQIRIKAEAAGASERSLELRPSSRASRRPAGYTHAHASPPANRVGFCCARALGLTASRVRKLLPLSSSSAAAHPSHSALKEPRFPPPQSASKKKQVCRRADRCRCRWTNHVHIWLP